MTEQARNDLRTAPAVTENRDRRREERIADSYRPDEYLEELLRLRETAPADFARTIDADPNLSLRLGLYESARNAARKVNDR